MLHHATRIGTYASSTFPSILQVAASRAWTRTTPARRSFPGTIRGHVGPSGAPASEVQKGRKGVTSALDEQEASTSFVTQLAVDDEHAPAYIQATRGFASHFAAGHGKAGKASSPSVEASTTEHVTASSAAVHAASELERRHERRRRRFQMRQNPWSARVSIVDANSLPVLDTSTVDPGRNLAAFETTDPPWSEIAEALTASELPPLKVRYGAFESHPAPPVPCPASPADLCGNILYFRSLDPPPTLEWLIRYHTAFRVHHTTASFNLLLALALRLARHGTARLLFVQMHNEGMSPDVRTRQLRVRFLVRFGARWQQAWEEQREHARTYGRSMPLDVWVEFFDREKRGAWRSWQIVDGKQELKPTEVADPSTLRERYQTLMQNLPILTADELVRVPPLVVQRVVRYMIRMNERRLAVDTTLSFFRELPEHLPSNLRRCCLAIIHLHMLPSSQRGLQEFHAMKELFFRLLGTHRQLRPTATTLFMLMRPLKRAIDGHVIGTRVARDFCGRWGRDMVDDKVLRRLASLLLARRRWQAARRIIRSQIVVEQTRREIAAEQEFANTGRRTRTGKLPVYLAFRPQRKGDERWKWRLLRRRLRRRRTLRVQARRQARQRVSRDKPEPLASSERPAG